MYAGIKNVRVMNTPFMLWMTCSMLLSIVTAVICISLLGPMEPEYYRDARTDKCFVVTNKLLVVNDITETSCEGIPPEILRHMTSRK